MSNAKRPGKTIMKCKHENCDVILDYRNKTGYCKIHSPIYKKEFRYCEICNKKLNSSQKYTCSIECSNERIELKRNRKRYEEFLIKKKNTKYCEICNKVLQSHNRSKFCSVCEMRGYSTLYKNGYYSKEIIVKYSENGYICCKHHRLFHSIETGCPMCTINRCKCGKIIPKNKTMCIECLNNKFKN